jgi:ribose transport system permease protein
MKNKSTLSNEMSIAEEYVRGIKREEQKDQILQLIPFGLLILIIIIFGAITPEFLTISNLYSNVLTSASILLVISTGVTFIFIIGCIDLSIEGVVGFAGCMLGLLVENSVNKANLGYLGIVISVFIATAIGLISGLIHVKMKLPSFIVTFSIGYIANGLGILTYGGVPALILEKGVRNLYFVVFLGLPVLTWLAFAVFLLGLFIEKKTAFGRHIFAVGDNEKIPVMSGVNVGFVKIKGFAFAGFCMGIAGVMGAARLGTAQIYIGQDYLFPTLTAVVVGGTSMSGGKGGLLNTLIGVLTVSILTNGMVMVGIPSIWQKFVLGLIILVMIVLTADKSSKQIVK